MSSAEFLKSGVVVDTHVHIYPFHDVDKAFGALLDNLTKAGPDALKIACLTERYDCNLYQDLAAGTDQRTLQDFVVEAEADCLRVRQKEGAGEFYLLPGQQIITAENIEILSVNCQATVEEGQSAVDTVRSVLDAGGLPVVAWAPGKWWFARGKVVAALMDVFTPAQLAFGDTTLRPIGWTTPLLLRKASRLGFKVLFGSDPLPFSGEEATAAKYSTRIDSAEGQHPAELMANLLKLPSKVTSAGRRGSLLAVLMRLRANSQAPRPARVAMKDRVDETNN